YLQHGYWTIREPVWESTRLRHLGRADLLHPDHCGGLPAAPQDAQRRAQLSRPRISSHAGALHPRRCAGAGDSVCLPPGDHMAGTHHRSGWWSGIRMSPTTLKEKSGLFYSIKSAILGDPHRDFTEGSIGRAIVMLAVPMVLEMMME